MATTKDYRPEEVRDRLVAEFGKLRRRATVADLVAGTGLPKARVEAELPAVADEFGARLEVTASGEILYSFPSGMRSRYRGFGPAAKRAWKGLKRGLVALGTWAFKAWIMVMLVGYFVLFLALALLATLASVAARSSDRDDRRGGGLGGLWLAGNLLDAFVRIWFYSELFKDPRQREAERLGRQVRKAARRPLHKAIFSFVFGDGDPNAAWDETEKKAVVAFVQAHKGVLTMPEFVALTGLSPSEAEDRITRYLVEFEGSPEVSPNGAIYYSFPSLMRRADPAARGLFGTSAPSRRTWAFSANPAKANRAFAAINAVNLAFGSYFLWGSLATRIPAALASGEGVRISSGFEYLFAFTGVVLRSYGGFDPSGLLLWGLGVVPLAFGALFYLIPALRASGLKSRNEAIKRMNLRSLAARAALENPSGVRPETVVPTFEEARPADPAAADKLLRELAAANRGEQGTDGAYTFPDIALAQAEAAAVRAGIKDSDFGLGETVFDSHS